MINKLFFWQTQPTPVPENWHEEFIVHLAKILRPKVYVELGLYKCELFNKLIPHAEKLIGVDMKKEWGSFMKKTPKTEFICSKTSEYAKYLKKNPIKIDLLFIDANHSAQAVKEDFKAYFPFISPHGIILLHDAHPKNKKYTSSGYCGDGYKSIEELSRETKSYEMVTIPIHPGLAICRKRKRQLSWNEK